MEIDKLNFYPQAEKMIDAICAQTQNFDRQFYRLLVAHTFCKVASMMRTVVDVPGRGKIPVNFYGLNLAPSGYSKGHSTRIIEDCVTHKFSQNFMDNTFNELALIRAATLAQHKAGAKGTDPDDEEAKILADFNAIGELLEDFDEATVPAIKQMRRKLQIAEAGALNFTVDEIGANLQKNNDVMVAFLELYDMGKIKEKLVKSTSENHRGQQMKGITPANMMIYGTPVKLFDGGATERAMMDFFDMGYARRCFFGYIPEYQEKPLSVEERLKLIKASSTDTVLEDVAERLLMLSDASQHGKTIRMTESVFRRLLEYQVFCEERMSKLPEHRGMERAEMKHRFFKVIKLAGGYAFYDGVMAMEDKHLDGAIKLAEESGEAFYRILNRERDYVRLAKFIGTCKNPVTHVDIGETLAFYPNTDGRRKEMTNMAMAWAYKNGIVFKKHFEEGIEMFSGSCLEETNLEKLTVSFGVGVGEGYKNLEAPWQNFHKMLLQPDANWVNHHLLSDHRHENNIAQGFDTVVFDVDGGAISTEMAQVLLEGYEYIIHTTKSHVEGDPHYRIVMPLSHKLLMDKEEYTEFMENLFDWLPIGIDRATKDRCRKWATNDKAAIYRGTGKLLDALSFVPKTKANEEAQKRAAELSNLDNIERWFVLNTGSGNRNNNLLRYGLLLVDAGADLIDIQTEINKLNEKLDSPLSQNELRDTVLRTISKKVVAREHK